MPLDAVLLGDQLYNRASEFNDKNPDEVGDLETFRRNYWRAIADEIITHFKDNAQLNVPGTGLVAGSNPVTGMSVTGSIE